MERRAFGTQGLEIRNEEERILSGVLVPYGSPTRIGGYTETFTRGAFEGTDVGMVPLLVSHDHAGLPVGRTLELVDGEAALLGEWRVAQTQAGDEVMALARDGVPLSLSIGFKPISDKWTSDRAHVTRIKAELGEVSVVGVGAYSEAKVVSVRADQVSPIGDKPRLMAARRIRR